MSTPGAECLIELRFPARPDRMVLVRETVRTAARYCGFDELTTRDIVLAVGEACQNAILHAYDNRNVGQIVLGILRSADSLVLRVTDYGETVDPSKIKPRNLQDLRPGGLGTHFIQELMDSADFGPSPDGMGNVLQMTKKTQKTGKTGKTGKTMKRGMEP
ncbi:ATP-binding protein [Pelagibius sp.]|uniref:ATP-binding protein n=1 Tax=Pelagibius sp. TaxID=1931238 RepID=UPI00260D8619|nr:ATP-binding protein [Pelagibius sp.]